jgi:streptogramin lyase
MNSSQLSGDLPTPVRRYFSEVSRIDPPLDLLDAVVAEIEDLPRPARFSLLPAMGVMAAAAVFLAVLVLNLFTTTPERVGTDESSRPSPTNGSAQPSPTLRPGVVPIATNPPIASIPVLDADTSETDVGRIGYPVLAAHGSVWFGHIGTGQLTRVDASTGEVSAVIDISPDPGTDRWDLLAVADDQWVYASSLDESLVKIDPTTDKVVQRIPVNTSIYRLELHGGAAYITSLDGGRVTRVDLAAEDVVWQAAAGVNPGGLEVTDEGVWVASYGDAAVLRLDPETGETLEEYRTYLHGMEIIHDGGDALYITGNQSRPVERISISEGRVTARAEEMNGLAIHDGELYGLQGEGHLVRLDPVTLEWQAVLDSTMTAAGMVAGEGAIWIYQGVRLLKVEPNQ